MFDDERHHIMTLLEGDCIEMMRSLPDASVDFICTDPPYGTTRCSWDAVIDFTDMWKEIYRVAKPDTAIALTASQPFTSALIMSNVKRFKHEWIWQKNAGSNFGAVRYQPMKEHESVLVFSKGKCPYYPQMQDRAASGLARVKTVVNYNTQTDHVGDTLKGTVSSIRPDQRYPSSIQKFNRERGLHPTQKPVELMQYLVATYSKPGDRVLDFTMGSGSTGVAALGMDRTFVGIENDPAYFEIARDRLQGLPH